MVVNLVVDVKCYPQYGVGLVVESPSRMCLGRPKTFHIDSRCLQKIHLGHAAD